MFRNGENPILLYSCRYVCGTNWKLRGSRRSQNEIHSPRRRLVLLLLHTRQRVYFMNSKILLISNNITGKQVRFALNVFDKLEWNLSLNIAVLQLCHCTVGRVNCCWLSTAQLILVPKDSHRSGSRATVFSELQTTFNHYLVRFKFNGI
jgi:hypothetical protein